jgi:predicted dehydrogenase
LTFEQADSLLTGADSRDLFWRSTSTIAFATVVRMAREAIDTGRLGQLVFACWGFGGEGMSNH